MLISKRRVVGLLLIPTVVILSAMGFSQPEGSLEELAFSSNVTTTFSSALTAGRSTIDGVADSAGNEKIHWLGSRYGGKKSRGVIITFMGVGADNATGSCRVWLVYQGGSLSTPDTNSIRRTFFGQADFTLSTQTGVASSILGDTSTRWADTITWQLSTTGTSIVGPGSALETAFGSPGSAAFSPTGNADIAFLSIPDTCNADGLVLEMDKGTATSVNATITKITN